MIAISILALTRSATCGNAKVRSQARNFNPRTHEECDPSRLSRMPGVEHFNPRTHEECDPRMYHLLNSSSYFNPRTHEECDFFAGFHVGREIISILALTRSATFSAKRKSANSTISILALTRSATNCLSPFNSTRVISILALTRSATRLLNANLIGY